MQRLWRSLWIKTFVKCIHVNNELYRPNNTYNYYHDIIGQLRIVCACLNNSRNVISSWTFTQNVSSVWWNKCLSMNWSLKTEAREVSSLLSVLLCFLLFVLLSDQTRGVFGSRCSSLLLFWSLSPQAVRMTSVDCY